MLVRELAVLAALASVVLAGPGMLLPMPPLRVRVPGVPHSAAAPLWGALGTMVCRIAEHHFPAGRLVVVAEQAGSDPGDGSAARCLLLSARWPVLIFNTKTPDDANGIDLRWTVRRVARSAAVGRSANQEFQKAPILVPPVLNLEPQMFQKSLDCAKGDCQP